MDRILWKAFHGLFSTFGKFQSDYYFRHSMSKNSPRTARSEQNGGSIVEEIEEEIDDDISIEADDLLRSERSAVSY